ncbi:MAG: S46 family peptidase [Deltaproteobacteria bacterium]|nr:S46 family peptidase [Deltaproteobacteria bacterium]
MTPRFRSALFLLLSASLPLLLAIPSSALADEGQWPPEDLFTLGEARWGELSIRGLERTAKDLWNRSGGGLLVAVIGVAGDFGWSHERSRNVNVDLRYALWLMDRVDGATALMKELLPGT